MVNYYGSSLNAIFSALADPTRRAMLERLARGESSVTELAEPFKMSLPAISKHLKVLESAGLLVRAKDGRLHRCRADPRPIQEAAEWIARYRDFWEMQFDALAEFLNETRSEEKSWSEKAAPKQSSSSAGASQLRGKKSSAPGRARKL